MVSYDTDEEQVEALMNWWKENGTQLMIGIVVVLAGTFGFQSWQASVDEQGESASALYEDLRAAMLVTSEISEEQVTTARYLADTLIKEHESTVYAKFAGLQMAKLSLERGELDQAEKDLQWVVDQDDDELRPLARIRLARIVLSQGDLERALSLANDEDQGAYKSSYAEVRGDIYLQMGKEADAREAYQTALNELAEAGSNPLVQMKLDDIVESVGQPNVMEATEEEAVDSMPEENQTEN